MGLELKRDLMGIFIGGNGRTGSDRATASGTGQMASVLGESGETGKCMGLEYSCGLRNCNTVASGSTISGMDLVSKCTNRKIILLHIKGNGRKEKDTVWVFA